MHTHAAKDLHVLQRPPQYALHQSLYRPFSNHHEVFRFLLLIFKVRRVKKKTLLNRPDVYTFVSTKCRDKHATREIIAPPSGE